MTSRLVTTLWRPPQPTAVARLAFGSRGGLTMRVWAGQPVSAPRTRLLPGHWTRRWRLAVAQPGDFADIPSAALQRRDRASFAHAIADPFFTMVPYRYQLVEDRCRKTCSAPPAETTADTSAVGYSAARNLSSRRLRRPSSSHCQPSARERNPRFGVGGRLGLTTACSCHVVGASPANASSMLASAGPNARTLRQNC